MKKFAFASILVAAFAAPGCIKTSSESTVNSDGSATVKMKIAYKKEVIANLKSMIEAQMGGEEEDGGGGGGEAVEKLTKFEAGFDDKKVTEEWKKLGLEVAKSSVVDKDGWKGIEIEGSVKNVAEYGRKHAEAMKKLASETEDGPMGAMPDMDPAKNALPRMPRFYKTDQPNVAKVVMSSSDSGAQNAQMDQLADMADEQREMIESQLDNARGMFALDDMKMEIRVKLPGKILSVSNAKQDGENTIVFEMLGSNFSADTLANMAKTKGVITATLQFDPKEFKIPLEDEPKAESKPAKSKDGEKPKKNEDEKKPKDEDK